VPKILFTGGGTAGHVTPNIALIEYFKTQSWEMAYVGSYQGIERTLITPLKVPYFPIASGKLHRYFTFKNFLTPFQVLRALWQSIRICRREKPDVVFSKGGFVALPVVFAAWLCRIPIVIHEADITPGLANKLSAPFAKTICVSFEPALKYYKNKHKVKITGIPLRKTILNGNKDHGLTFCGFNHDKPVLMVCGGSLGAQSLNRITREILTPLLEQFQVIHVCGKNKLDPQLKDIEGYRQFEYVNDAFGDLLACADIVVSRAGANSVYELLSLHIPHIFIPLPKAASRGDQIINAQYHADLGLSEVIFEENLTADGLLTTIKALFENRVERKKQLAERDVLDSTTTIAKILSSLVATSSSVVA